MNILLHNETYYKWILERMGAWKIEYRGQRFYRGQPIKSFNWEKVYINGRPLGEVFLPMISNLRFEGVPIKKNMFRRAIREEALKNWTSPEDVQVLQMTKTGPDGNPILTGKIANYKEIEFKCPWCGKLHHHGWAPGDITPTSRQSHCAIYRGVYWIDLQASDK